MTEIYANYDEPWKEAINDYLPDFLKFFFPENENVNNVNIGDDQETIEEKINEVLGTNNLQINTSNDLDKIAWFNAIYKYQKDVMKGTHDGKMDSGGNTYNNLKEKVKQKVDSN
jgi:tryptophanyl-tRNA synthetase